MWFEYRPYVSVAQRRAKAAKEIAKRTRKGQSASPVVIAGRTIASTFWGKAWCDNLESYSDYENRLPRGRTYVRNGSVVDLQIKPGHIKALVSGSELYEIDISIAGLDASRWRAIKSKCAGQIGSLVELLQGRLSKGVMDIVTARTEGLFPKPAEIDLRCSCPDSAGMCKHIAAVMYGIGSRLDRQPELLFALRKVDHLQLICEAVPTSRKNAPTGKTLQADDVADMFGIELAPGEAIEAPAPKKEKRAKVTATAKPAEAKNVSGRGKSKVVSKRTPSSRSKLSSATSK